MTLDEILVSLEIGIIYGIVAVAIYLTLRIINFADLTCDGSFVLGAAVSSVLIKINYNPLVAIFMALIAGFIAGIITGILNTYFKITDILSGILVSFMLYSINLRIMSDIPNISLIDLKTIFDFKIAFGIFGRMFDNLSILILLIIFSFIVCFSIIYLLMTDFGLGLRVIGQNIQFAINNGINVSLLTIIGLALSNSLIAASGALFSQYQGATDIGNGIGTLVIGMASIIIGEKIFPYKSIIIKIISCLVGSIIYRFLISLALHGDILGIKTQDVNLITGVMILVIMQFQKIKNK